MVAGCHQEKRRSPALWKAIQPLSVGTFEIRSMRLPVADPKILRYDWQPRRGVILGDKLADLRFVENLEFRVSRTLVSCGSWQGIVLASVRVSFMVFHR